MAKARTRGVEAVEAFARDAIARATREEIRSATRGEVERLRKETRAAVRTEAARARTEALRPAPPTPAPIGFREVEGEGRSAHDPGREFKAALQRRRAAW